MPLPRDVKTGRDSLSEDSSSGKLTTRQDFEKRYIQEHTCTYTLLQTALGDLSQDVADPFKTSSYNDYAYRGNTLDYSKLNEEYKKNKTLSDYVQDFDATYENKAYFNDKESYDSFMKSICNFLLKKIWVKLQEQNPKEFKEDYTCLEIHENRKRYEDDYSGRFDQIYNKFDRTDRDSEQFKALTNALVKAHGVKNMQAIENLEKTSKEYLEHCVAEPRKFSSRRSSRIKNVRRVQKICAAYRKGMKLDDYLKEQIATQIYESYNKKVDPDNLRNDSNERKECIEQILNTKAFKQMVKENETIDLFHKIENPKTTLKEFLKQYDRLDRKKRNDAPNTLDHIVDALEDKQKSMGKSR